MCKNDIVSDTCEFFQTVVIEYVTNQIQRVTLYQTYMSIGIKTIGCLVEQCTVAIHQCVVVFELNVSDKELSISIFCVVKIQYIRVQQVHSVIGMGTPDDAEYYQNDKQ